MSTDIADGGQSWAAKLETAVERQSQADTDGSHDIGHLRRVWTSAQTIAATELVDVDPEILIAAAYLHDIVNLAKDDPDRSRASQLSAIKAENILQGLSFPEAKIPAVMHAIEAHSFSAQIEPQTVEAKIVQDADRLEALGAIGIARTFYVSGLMRSALFDPTDPFADKRPLDDRRFALDHFATKLYPVAQTMKTAKGRALAAERVASMQSFCDQLSAELTSCDG